MKPKTTWILLANARTTRVVQHRGVGQGLTELDDMTWHADPPVEYSDRAGMGHSSAGPGVSAVDQGDPQEQADLAFAKVVCERLESAAQSRKFDNLVICAGPHMLGLLRKHMSEPLRGTITEEISKDFSSHDLKKLEENLSSVLRI